MVGASPAGKLIQGGWVIAGSEEQRAAALLADRFGAQATTMLVVFTDPAGDAASPAFQRRSTTSSTRSANDPAVDGSHDLRRRAGRLRSSASDGATTLAVVAT